MKRELRFVLFMISRWNDDVVVDVGVGEVIPLLLARS